MSPELLGIIAGILGIVGDIPYIYTTIHGKTRPNCATWIIWMVVGGLLAFSYMAEGDSNGIWLPLSYFIGPMLISLLSIRYGYLHWTRLDTICIVIAIISIIPWVLSNNATFTLLINLLIDSVGAIPTLVKAYKEPETEDFSAWLIFFAASIFELFAISTWNIAALYPIYLFFLIGTVVALIARAKIKNLLFRA